MISFFISFLTSSTSVFLDPPFINKKAAIINSTIAAAISIIILLSFLNLYLDLHGDDKEMYKIFKAYVKREMDLEEEYVSKYGPLCVKDSGDGFSWINGPWSWDNNGGIKYV